MEEKKSNLVLSADVTSSEQMLRVSLLKNNMKLSIKYIVLGSKEIKQYSIYRCILVTSFEIDLTHWNWKADVLNPCYL